MSKQWWLDRQEFQTTDSNTVFVFSMKNDVLITKSSWAMGQLLLKVFAEETTAGDFRITQITELLLLKT